MQRVQTDSVGPILEFASSSIFSGFASDENGARVPLRARPHTGQMPGEGTVSLVIGSEAIVVSDMSEPGEFNRQEHSTPEPLTVVRAIPLSIRSKYYRRSRTCAG